MPRPFPYQARGEPLQIPAPAVDRWYAPPPDPVPANLAAPWVISSSDGQVLQPWLPPPGVASWYAPLPDPVIRARAAPWLWPDFTEIASEWFAGPSPLSKVEVSWWYAPPPGPTVRAQAAPWLYSPSEGLIRRPWLPAPVVSLWYFPPPQPIPTKWVAMMEALCGAGFPSTPTASRIVTVEYSTILVDGNRIDLVDLNVVEMILVSGDTVSVEHSTIEVDDSVIDLIVLNVTEV